jgi:Cdc6-like AAA superfamily ATPase
LHRLTFEPYKHDQLVTIVNSRLNDLNVFNVCRSPPPLVVFRHYCQSHLLTRRCIKPMY